MKSFGFNKIFIAAILSLLSVRILFFLDYSALLWDSAVYVSMGKFLFSLGTQGLWEHIRPVIWPFFLGFFWRIGLDPVLFGSMLELLLFAGCLLLIKLFVGRYYGENAGIMSSVLLGTSAIFFYESFNLYTEIPSLFFILLALVLFEKKAFFAGFSLALAFITKFPVGIFLPVIIIAYLIEKRWKNSVISFAGFSIPSIIFLISNKIAYGSALLPLIDASSAIRNVLGCNVLHYHPWTDYFIYLWKDNYFFVFALLGMFLCAINWRKFSLPLLSLLVPLIYFLQLHCREHRYLIFVIPFVIFFASGGLSYVVAKLEKRFKRKLFVFVIIVLLFYGIHNSVQFYRNAAEPRDSALEAYLHFIENKDVSGEVWSSNPGIGVYSSVPVKKIYYPVFDASLAASFASYLEKNKEKISYVFLDNCGGGIICPDSTCEAEYAGILKQLSTFSLDYNVTEGKCSYLVFSRA